jgi:superfamily II DNA or RNA helicase
MHLEVSNLHVRVAQCSGDERTWLHNYCSYEDKRPRWLGGAGYISLYDIMNDTFPTGFLPGVLKSAATQGFEVTHEDWRRQMPALADRDDMLGWLRDYQRQAVERVLTRGRGILHLPGGAGKTEIPVALALVLPGARVLVTVPSKDLLWQTANRYHARTGRQAGVVGDGRCELAPFTVATYQTLYERRRDPTVRDLLDQAHVLVCDEGHTVPANRLWELVMATPRAFYRVAMSATPLHRTDKRSVYTIAATGPVIMRVMPALLIERGYLAAPEIHMRVLEQRCDLKTYPAVYQRLVVESRTRNGLLIQQARGARKPAFLFVRKTEHGSALAADLRAAGMRADFMWGKGSTKARQAALARLASGELEVLVCSVIFQQGIDLPELRSVVVGTAGESAIEVIQRLSRGSRVTEGKTTFEVYDILDVGNRFLARHAKKRKAAYESEGYNVLVDTGDRQERMAACS